MTFKGLFSVGALLVSCALAHAAPELGVKTGFSLKTRTQIPGRTLQPGSYNISLVDHLRDRLILRVDGPGAKGDTFLGLPSANSQAQKGPVMLKAGATAPAALRGFAFSDGTFAEFVYPKDEAVALAKANDSKIPAIDPASEGKPNTLASLSNSDMELVTLWVLSPTAVGPNSTPGIQAARYKAPVEDASSSAPAPPPAHRAKRSVLAALPHTASELPLISGLGLLSFACAGLLTQRRLARSRA